MRGKPSGASRLKYKEHISGQSGTDRSEEGVSRRGALPPESTQCSKTNSGEGNGEEGGAGRAAHFEPPAARPPEGRSIGRER